MLQLRATMPVTPLPTHLVRPGRRFMADAPSARTPAEATGFRSRAPQASACGAEWSSALHRHASCSIVPTWTALNSTPRFLRGIPYPFTFDSVRCHA
jgi:hypothetical protein